MTQNQRLDCLVEEFRADSGEYKDLQTPADTDEKRCILRSLTNIRMSRKMNKAALRIRDKYLKERIHEDGIVKLADIPMIRDDTSVWRGDITWLAIDIIVNVANLQMPDCFTPMHTCTDDCAHTFTDAQPRAECKHQMDRSWGRYGGDYEQPTAVPILVDVYNPPAKKVVHTVRPIVQYELTPKLGQNLTDRYRNTLNMYVDHNLVNMAFCCISTSVFHFPDKRAVEIAVQTVNKWMREYPGYMERVVSNIFQDENGKHYEELV